MMYIVLFRLQLILLPYYFSSKAQLHYSLKRAKWSDFGNLIGIGFVTVRGGEGKNTGVGIGREGHNQLVLFVNY